MAGWSCAPARSAAPAPRLDARPARGAAMCATGSGVDIVPRRHGPDRRTRLMRLGDDPQLLLHAPAPAAFPFIISIVLSGMALRRTLRWTLRPTVSPHPARIQQGGDHRTVTQRGLPPCLNEASYSGQFVTRYRALGIRWGRSAWYLNGKAKVPGGWMGLPMCVPPRSRQPGTGSEQQRACRPNQDPRRR